ncbi:MAG: WcaF family extracellular polysaccharide biosynthesis acetyltransferase [Flavobacteriales bacterium]|jgi:putative colanic acid biosynthesis acetyltransferase WcaF
MASTDLSRFNNSWYRPGNAFKRLFWYFTSVVFLESAFPLNSFKKFLLRLFGAQIGSGVVIKPRVRIKYPWKLRVGNDTWIGEDVWIDNLDEVHIGSNCCLSQGSFLLCGNHDYKKSTFDLITKPITLEDGAWVGAKSVVCPGVILKSHAVLSVGSVATHTLEAYSIYQGNPAVLVRKREISS